MKKSIKIISLVFIISVIFNLNYSCFAGDDDNDLDDNDLIDTSILSDSFVSGLNPEGLDGMAETLSTPIVNFIHRIVNPILGFIQIIGGLMSIVSVAMFGFGLFLNGNDKLANDLDLGFARKRRTRCKNGAIRVWQRIIHRCNFII